MIIFALDMPPRLPPDKDMLADRFRTHVGIGQHLHGFKAM